jgi:hypothetical protein
MLYEKKRMVNILDSFACILHNSGDLFGLGSVFLTCLSMMFLIDLVQNLSYKFQRNTLLQKNRIYVFGRSNRYYQIYAHEVYKNEVRLCCAVEGLFPTR